MDSVKVSFPGLGIDVNVSDVAFTLGKIDIYWYGVIIAVGMILCVILALKDCKANKFPDDLVYDILLVSLPSAIIGARLYYVVCEWSYYSKDLSRIFDTRSGGLAVYGGVMGAFLGAFIMAKIRKIPFNACADYCIPYIPLGQAIGRWGNFFNQEAFGTTTTLPWGMTSSKVSSYLSSNCPELDSTMRVHPTFLYESIVDLALFFILLQVRKKSKHMYETTCMYMIVYGLFRFLIEGLRTDSLYIGSTNIRTSQLLSLVLVLFGLIWIAVAHTKAYMRTPVPEKFFVLEKSAKAVEVEEPEENTELPEMVDDEKEEEKPVEKASNNSAKKNNKNNKKKA